jgi:hypothetical protein
VKPELERESSGFLFLKAVFAKIVAFRYNAFRPFLMRYEVFMIEFNITTFPVRGMDTMKKSIIAILFIAAIIFGWNWYSKQNIHKPIPLNNVESVVLWGSGIPESHQGRKATKDEVSQIIEWFNSVKDIRVNENFAGATPDAGIRITLKSGEQTTIIDSLQIVLEAVFFRNPSLLDQFPVFDLL